CLCTTRRRLSMEAKACHPGLRARSRFLGLEPVDMLLIVPPYFLFAVVLERLELGLIAAFFTGLALYMIKRGRLPGFTLALLRYLMLPSYSSAMGHDTVPLPLLRYGSDANQTPSSVPRPADHFTETFTTNTEAHHGT